MVVAGGGATRVGRWPWVHGVLWRQIPAERLRRTAGCGVPVPLNQVRQGVPATVAELSGLCSRGLEQLVGLRQAGPMADICKGQNSPHRNVW